MESERENQYNGKRIRKLQDEECIMQESILEMQELIRQLNEASDAYYNGLPERMKYCVCRHT